MTNFNAKRITILTALSLVPAAAFAAATGSDGGLCASFCGLLGCCG